MSTYWMTEPNPHTWISLLPPNTIVLWIEFGCLNCLGTIRLKCCLSHLPIAASLSLQFNKPRSLVTGGWRMNALWVWWYGVAKASTEEALRHSSSAIHLALVLVMLWTLVVFFFCFKNILDWTDRYAQKKKQILLKAGQKIHQWSSLRYEVFPSLSIVLKKKKRKKVKELTHNRQNCQELESTPFKSHKPVWYCHEH